MKRQIKFRGKRVDNGKWVIGDLTTGTIMVGCIFVHIIPESAGQFTGLQDKNGVDIYEGDIISHFGDRILIEYDDSLCGFNICYGICECQIMSCEIDIIGNIHDNPELI